MDLINAGDAAAGFAAFGQLPAWFFEVVFKGGVGLVSAGQTAQTTLYLEPGVYVIECYVKTGGKFHGLFGMAKQLVVTQATTDAAPPKASLQMTLSREGGLAIEGKLRPGLQTIAVHFQDQGPHEHFLGHDVHLVRLTDNSDVASLEAWMDWSSPTGMETPAPEGVFMGGAQEMPAGSTAYITAQLRPGRYAFIAEVPAPSSKGMLYTFQIPEGKRAAR
ncbi:hypothetical protein [Cesiribacter andamanensis]|uniref:Uncharacterized protein n=1 Tax=Cesiribacter andamanensis AMV16 TaxID=1279009 RepID=M7NU10_9BACT|nr:hypothetical protein [Cesiribacter andamanensis]EMR01974.1 hypothetical protein ADICEAN_02909 [Cesiribacter andamanensis AMV16]